VVLLCKTRGRTDPALGGLVAASMQSARELEEATGEIASCPSRTAALKFHQVEEKDNKKKKKEKLKNSQPRLPIPDVEAAAAAIGQRQMILDNFLKIIFKDIICAHVLHCVALLCFKQNKLCSERCNVFVSFSFFGFLFSFFFFFVMKIEK
jgi:hypothetical protein